MKLPNVTLICCDCVDAARADKVLNYCTDKIKFADVKLLTSEPVWSRHRVEITPLESLVMYSIFMLTRLHEYFDTTHVLVVQRDGFILNADSWNDEWLELDYIGPLFMQYDKAGSGGFSMRSREIMRYAAQLLPKWDGTKDHANEIQKTLGYYEDGVLSMSEQFRHFRKASNEQAADFAEGGNRNMKYHRDRPFGFHRTWKQIDFETGVVDGTDMKRDITKGYDNEIDRL